MAPRKYNKSLQNAQIEKNNKQAIKVGRQMAKRCLDDQAIEASSEEDSASNNLENTEDEEDEEDKNSQGNDGPNSPGAAEFDEFLNSLVKDDSANPPTGPCLNGDPAVMDMANFQSDPNPAHSAVHGAMPAASVPNPPSQQAVAVKMEPGTTTSTGDHPTHGNPAPVSASPANNQSLKMALKRKMLEAQGQNMNGAISSQFKRAKRNGTAIIVVTFVNHEGQGGEEELATLFLRTNSFKSFLNQLSKLLPFFKTDSTIAYLEKHFGKENEHLWAFLKDILYSRVNAKYNFQSFSFLSSFSPGLYCDEEYHELRAKIIDYIKTEPMDENNTAGYDEKRIYLDEKKVVLSGEQIEVLAKLTELFDLRENELSPTFKADRLRYQEMYDDHTYGHQSIPGASSSSASANTVQGHFTPPHPDATNPAHTTSSTTTQPATAPPATHATNSTNAPAPKTEQK